MKKGTRNPIIDFKNGKGLITIDKHGYDSPEAYLLDATNFLEKPPTPTTQSFVLAEGTYFRYETYKLFGASEERFIQNVIRPETDELLEHNIRES